MTLSAAYSPFNSSNALNLARSILRAKPTPSRETKPALSQMSSKDSSPAILSPDGKFMLYYYRENAESESAKIEIVPVTGGDPTISLDAPKDSHDEGWSPDGKAIVYIKDENRVSNVWSQPLDGGSPRQLTNWSAEQIFAFAWSRDGKQLAVSRGRVSTTFC